MSQKPKKPVKKPPEIKGLEKDFSHEGKLIIKYSAYMTMISHVLRFGNDGLENSVEVLGVCMGEIAKNGNDLICHEVVPINHGSGIDVGFNEQDYIAFASIDEEYGNKGWFAIGWYHSHPKLGVFFSDTDIKNHLFWQKEQTPMSFGIVFDHALMGKDDSLGFMTFRLDDFRLGPASDFHEIVVEVEPPNSLDFYKQVKRLVEDSQKKNPEIQKELNEMVELQEIPLPEEGLIIDEKAESPFKSTIVGFNKGTQEFSEVFLSTLQTQLSMWTKDITTGTSKGSSLMANAASTMQEAIAVGMKKVRNWFERTLESQAEDFKESIKKQVEGRMETEKELITEINSKIETIISDIIKVINDEIVQKIVEIGEKIKGNTILYDDLAKTQESATNQITSQTEVVKNFNENIDSLTNGISDDINSIAVNLDSILSEETKRISMDLTTVKSQGEKLSDLMEKLQKTIMEMRNL